MKKESVVLAIETAVETGSLSILKGNNEVASSIGDRKVSRSEDLLIMISEILKKSDLNISDLDLISVSVGPGSFTGVRVVLAVAKALAFGLNCPGVGVSVLEALAFGKENLEETVVVVVPAGRSQIFWQSFYSEELRQKEKSLPRVGGLDDFLYEIESAGSSKVSIITVSRLYTENPIFFNKLSSEISIENASDNISKLIGLTGLSFMEKNQNSKDSFCSGMVPQYILGVR